MKSFAAGARVRLLMGKLSQLVKVRNYYTVERSKFEVEIGPFIAPITYDTRRPRGWSRYELDFYSPSERRVSFASILCTSLYVLYKTQSQPEVYSG